MQVEWNALGRSKFSSCLKMAEIDDDDDELLFVNHTLEKIELLEVHNSVWNEIGLVWLKHVIPENLCTGSSAGTGLGAHLGSVAPCGKQQYGVHTSSATVKYALLQRC